MLRRSEPMSARTGAALPPAPGVMLLALWALPRRLREGFSSCLSLTGSLERPEWRNVYSRIAQKLEMQCGIDMRICVPGDNWVRQRLSVPLSSRCLQSEPQGTWRARTSDRDDGGVRELRAELAVHGDLVQLRLAAHAGVVGVQEVRRAHLEAVEAPVRDLRLQPLQGNSVAYARPCSKLSLGGCLKSTAGQGHDEGCLRSQASSLHGAASEVMSGSDLHKGPCLGCTAGLQGMRVSLAPLALPAAL